jgi:hypothetical protein
MYYVQSVKQLDWMSAMVLLLVAMKESQMVG